MYTLCLLYWSVGCLQSACGMVVVVMVSGALLQVYCLASCQCLYNSRACMVYFCHYFDCWSSGLFSVLHGVGSFVTRSLKGSLVSLQAECP